jgi:hypothetical protein
MGLMKKCMILGKLVLAGLLVSPVLWAGTAGESAAVGLGVGHSDDEMMLGEISLRPQLNGSMGRFLGADWDALLDVGIGFWRETSSRHDDSFTFTTRPTVHGQWWTGPQTAWYAELGVGPGYIDDKTIDDQQMGGHFQFSTRLGVGMVFNRVWMVGYGFQHWSNAGIYHDNDGIQLHMIEFKRMF